MAAVLVLCFLSVFGWGALGLHPDHIATELEPQLSVLAEMGTEKDVATTVRYCISKDIPFLAPNGGHGWAETFHLGPQGLLILTIGGGAVISDVITAAAENNALVLTGNCNCVGTLGAVLGAGYGNLMGLLGLGVDNVLSLNVVLPNGSLKTVTAANDDDDDDDDETADLFWALRSAGPNFGIVTSATMKPYPVPPSARPIVAWTGMFLFFTTTGPPQYTPRVSASAGFCTKGGNKPAYRAGLARLDAETWRKTWEEYVAFAARNSTERSLVFLEAYSMGKARSLPESSSVFPWRDRVNFNATIIPWYQDTRLRDLWWETDECDASAAYVNFAYGDEDLRTIYGGSVERLQALKESIDPDNVFNQWYPLSDNARWSRGFEKT
ncbi:hypothetical protein BJX76DRAFT_349727 [Aspergillus varians]